MNTKGQCYPKSIILQAVYFKHRFTLSYRDIEEIMKIPCAMILQQNYYYLLLTIEIIFNLKALPVFAYGCQIMRSSFLG